MTDGKIVRRLEKSDLAALAGIADAAGVSP